MGERVLRRYAPEELERYHLILSRVSHSPSGGGEQGRKTISGTIDENRSRKYTREPMAGGGREKGEIHR